MSEACMLIANMIPICQQKQPFKLKFCLHYDIILSVAHWILEIIVLRFNMQGDDIIQLTDAKYNLCTL